MVNPDRTPWKASLHGGHSGEFCEHATGTLRDVLEAAVAAGYSVFGVSEHAPRSQDRFLYPSERDKGYTVERLRDEFEAYAVEVGRLSEEFADRLTVLRGFEAEIVPSDSYRREMMELRARHGFDYMVGSVHYVDEAQIDGPPEEFARLIASAGGFENVAERYYDKVAEMVEGLRPEVVGHLDLIRRNAPTGADAGAPSIRAAARRALRTICAADAVLDLNTAGWRKGLGSPYPEPWLVRAAAEEGIGFCFGDDSHGPDQVGAGIDEARLYLLDNGVSEVIVPCRRSTGLTWEAVAL